ncbi:hypothetical protein EE090_22940 [Klebsiella pneumoniae]|nr:hypothetical protein [Klebsiella pneumoniae]
MPRLYEIETACRNAIDILPNGKRILTTRRFLQELERYNWHWSRRRDGTCHAKRKVTDNRRRRSD